MFDIFCKMCQRITPHMDFRPLPVQFKCSACGEYNKPLISPTDKE